MGIDQPSQITRLLREVSAGDQEAERALLDQVYDQLKIIAQQRMAYERRGHTLQATALVHEAYMRLVGRVDGAGNEAEPLWCDRAHFYRAAAEAMRRILIEHARKRGAVKRGGDLTRMPLNVGDLVAEGHSDRILALDEAIVRLQGGDPTAAEIARLRFYAGLSIEQTAAALGLSERTVKRSWTYARARLFSFLEEMT